jgi:hypothetical protein
MPGIRKRLTRYLESLRFPWLLLATAILFVVSVLVPDALPFVDELLLALVAVILGRIKRKPRGKAQNDETKPPA